MRQNMKIKCNHDLAEQETMCADGYCPICLIQRIKELEDGIRKHKKTMDKYAKNYKNVSYCKDEDEELYELLKKKSG